MFLHASSYTSSQILFLLLQDNVDSKELTRTSRMDALLVTFASQIDKESKSATDDGTDLLTT